MAADVSPWRGAARRPGDGGVREGVKEGAERRWRRGRSAPCRPGGPARSEGRRRPSKFVRVYLGLVQKKKLWLKFASLGGAAAGEISFWAVKQYFKL